LNRPLSAPQIVDKPKNTRLLEGSEVTFQVNITGNPLPRVIWFKNGKRILQSQRCIIDFKDNIATLSILMVLPEDSGFYTLFTENKSGCALCSIYLYVDHTSDWDSREMEGVQYERYMNRYT
jgi:hypothetical protein